MSASGPDIPLRRLGKTDIRITPIGLGCWQFSGRTRRLARYWPPLDQETTRGIVRAGLEGGINWFDTAEVYGGGTSERNLATTLKSLNVRPGDVHIATKWWPLMRSAANITSNIDTRLQCLDGFPVDLFQVHQPVSFSSVEKEMAAMAAVLRAGKVRAVGVSNFSVDRMDRARRALEDEGLVLASNQVSYSLVRRNIERNGILDYAKEHGISIIAWSPLGQGICSGKFHDNPELIRKRQGPRRYRPEFRSKGLAKTRPVVETLREVANRHNVTPSEVALAWLIRFHGETVLAIPGATKESHARINTGAMGLELAQDEMDELESVSRHLMGTSVIL